jgi:hypothetical protein
MHRRPWGAALALVFTALALGAIVTAVAHPDALRDAISNLSPTPPAEVAPSPPAEAAPPPVESQQSPVAPQRQNAAPAAEPTTRDRSAPATSPRGTTPVCVVPNSDSP